MLVRHCGRKCKLIAILTCLVVGVLLWTSSIDPTHPRPSPPVKNYRLSSDLTVIIRQFEEFDNNLGETARIWSAFLGAPALILADRPFNPPIFVNVGVRNSSVRVISLELLLTASPKDLDPLSYVHTEFVLLTPDWSRPLSKRMLKKLLTESAKLPDDTALVLTGSKQKKSCQNVIWSYLHWTLRYELPPAKTTFCGSVRSRHALLIRTSVLRELPHPFLLPFPEALYLQTSVRNIKLQPHADAHITINHIPMTAISRVRSVKLERERRNQLYQRLGVKKLVREDGSISWFGCTRDTERCLKTADRYTPPCCLAHLRRTASYALGELARAGARVWLESTFLLGALTRGDLLPWVERVEIGVYSDDVLNVSWLRTAEQRGYVTHDGYVWERATGGHYYRVAFSVKNRIYVDILPFQPRNGTMTRDGWFIEHQKDFPEHYLHPMTSVQFDGAKAPAPNNINQFLNVKFGPKAMTWK